MWFVIILYFLLLIISFFLFLKSLKRKNVLQLCIYGLCMLFSGYRIADAYIATKKYTDKEITRAIDGKSLNDIRNGDTATLEGLLSFRRYSTEIEDTLKKMGYTQQMATDGNHILLDIIDSHFTQTDRLIISVSAETMKNLDPYLDYDRQKKDTTSYKLLLRALKTDTDNHHWHLLEILKIDSLKKMPGIEMVG